jgi:hypothetical protein
LHDELNLSGPGGLILRARERVQMHVDIIHDSLRANKIPASCTIVLEVHFLKEEIMFSKFLDKWLDRSDEKFLKNVSDIESRRGKIQELRYWRSSLNLVMGVLLLVNSISIVLLLFTQRPMALSDISPFLLILLTYINFSSIDSQLKMLLLFDKTNASNS